MRVKKDIQVTVSEDGKDLPTEKKSKAKRDNKDNRVRLLCMIFLTFGYFLVEIIVGYMTDSVAMVADSFHMLSDVISLIIAYIAVRMSVKKWSKNTFGWARAEVLGALVNAVFLVALCFTIVAESLERFYNIKNIENPFLILIVGSIGLIINLIALVLFHGHGHSHGGGESHGHSHEGKNHGHSHSHVTNDVVIEKNKSVDLVNWTILPPTDFSTTETTTNKTSKENETKSKPSSASQMNMHGVFLHVLADALGSVIVIISALVIWLTDWSFKMYVDPLLSLLMVILIICSVWPLFVESAMVLLQTVPTHIQIDELKGKLLSKVEGTIEVHEFHIWQLSGNKVVLSAHILCNNQQDFMRIGEEVKQFFHSEGIHSTTIQLEFANQNNQIQQQQSSSEFVGDSSGEYLDVGGDVDSDTRSDCCLTCPFDDEDAECVNNSCCGVQKRKIMTRNSSRDNLGYIEDNHPHS